MIFGLVCCLVSRLVDTDVAVFKNSFGGLVPRHHVCYVPADVTARLLDPNPHTRLTGSQLLSSPWMTASLPSPALRPLLRHNSSSTLSVGSSAGSHAPFRSYFARVNTAVADADAAFLGSISTGSTPVVSSQGVIVCNGGNGSESNNGLPAMLQFDPYRGSSCVSLSQPTGHAVLTPK